MTAKLHLPMRVRKLGTALLDQQLWCLGRDLFHPEGNALIRYGLTCHRVPDKRKGCHAYVHDVAPSRRVVVWGFGVYCGDDVLGGAFLKRYAFSPQRAALARLPMPLWRVDQLPAFGPPRGDSQVSATVALTRCMLTWLNAYESWVFTSLGPAWRELCLNAWRHKPIVAPADMASAWATLCAQVCENAHMLAQRSARVAVQNT